MEPDGPQSPIRAAVSVAAPLAGSTATGRMWTTSPTAGRSLGEEADGLIRELFGCGFTIAGVQSRSDVSAELTAQLTDLLAVLDDAIREIRHALCATDTNGSVR
jgi:hypothetical protein